MARPRRRCRGENLCFIIIVVFTDSTATGPCVLALARKQKGVYKCLGERFREKMSGKVLTSGSGRSGSEELIPA